MLGYIKNINSIGLKAITIKYLYLYIARKRFLIEKFLSILCTQGEIDYLSLINC